MRTTEAPRPVRVRATTSGSFLSESADYDDGFAIDVLVRDERSPEQWARASLEGAPVALRWFVVVGWRLVLGLRLGPRHTSDHVLGWRITRSDHDETVLEARSVFLTAHLVFHRLGTRIVWSTFVRYDRAVAKLLWPPVSLLHRRIVPYALRSAASQLPT